MTVRQIVKHYSKASEGRFIIEDETGINSFSFEGLDGLIERDAPILKRPVGLIKVTNEGLVITAYKQVI